MLNALDWLLKHTLRSVPFGITLLSLIAVYIAIGSGLAQVREYFEKDELAFFNSWPLITLMILLVTTLITVTIERIPLTPPRMGAWIIHTGIVTLVFGAFYHYSTKVEGMTLIPVGQTVSHYFDRWERALYLRAEGIDTRVPLIGLPRFNAYDESLGNAGYLDRASLKNLIPVNPGGKVLTAPEQLGVKDLKFSVVGYWPYADLRVKLIPKPSSKDVGFSMLLPDPDDISVKRDILLVGTNMKYARATWGSIDFEHRPVESEQKIQEAIASTLSLHELQIKVAGYEQTHYVQVGQTVGLGTSGYSVFVEAFNPRWQTMDRKIRPMLTLMVQTPTAKFRRQVLVDVEKPTDWVLGAEGAGPLGQRQEKPLDEQLKIAYKLNDTQNLLPREGSGQYTFFTTPDSNKTIVIIVPLNEPAAMQTLEGDSPSLVLRPPITADAMMMASARGQPVPKPSEVTVGVTRQQGVGVAEYVEEVPRQKRNRDTGEGGLKQIVRVRAQSGDWQQDVYVPYTPQATKFAWSGGLLNVPGAKVPAQLQLSNNIRNLPANIRLDKFEAQAYGGLEAQAGTMIRNFQSFITITNRTSGVQTPGVVSLNEPVFYDNSNWIFFQSQWDPDGKSFTVLGIGNRPGTLAMGVGCVLIIVGIFYAFYVKPIIIKVMKQRALEKAQQEKKIKGLSPVETV